MIKESATEEVVRPATLMSNYNGLKFSPPLNGNGRDFVTPMAMKEDGVFRVVSGGGAVGKRSISVPDAPFLPSKIQGRKEEPKSLVGD